jgi:excisionase family DNA binding protein
MSKATIPNYGSIREAAAIVPCSERTVRRAVAQGLVPAYRFGPRILRIDLDGLVKAMRPVPTACATA